MRLSAGADCYLPRPQPHKQPNVVAPAGGGANAFATFNRFSVRAPANTGMVVVPVQYLAPSPPIALTETLARALPMPLKEFRGDPNVEPWRAIE